MGDIILLGVVLAGLGLLSFMALCQRRVLASPAPDVSEDLPGVSILKPLKGVDPSLASNLATFHRQDYPTYEVLCGAEDPRDPALDVARSVGLAHPRTPGGVHAGGATGVLNPKVANLTRLIRRARFPVILVSDSNAAADPRHLRDMVARLLRPGVGVVSAPILGVPGSGLGAALESLQLNTFVMGGVAALASVGGTCVVGKSMMIRRDDLERIGGLDHLGRFLAEDQVCGEEMARIGKRSVVAALPVRNHLGALGFRGFAARHLRWARIRARMCPAGYAGEILLNPVFLAACGAAALRTPASAAILAGAVLARCALDAAAERTAGNHRALLHYLPLVPLRDLSLGVLWPMAFLGGTVAWRGTTYRIGARTRIEPADAPAPTGPAWAPVPA
jgi:ceramide glucosyltransferase